MRLHSYVVARDYGFAPNPFFGVCTLATCKPKIRSAAAIGDWVMGTGSKPTQREKNVGGFGGCTASLIEALKGGTPDVLTDAFQIREPLNKAVADRYRTVAEGGKTTAVDYAAEVRFLNGTGVGGLNNGVSADENEILFTSKNLPEIVHLLLKGLTAHSRSAGK